MSKEKLVSSKPASTQNSRVLKSTGFNNLQKKEEPFFKPVSVLKTVGTHNSDTFIQRETSERYEYKDENEGSFFDYFMGAVAGGLADIGSPSGAFSVALYGLDKGLPRILLINYAYGGGDPYKLTKSEMRACVPGLKINFSNDPKYKSAKDELLKTQKQVSYTSEISFTASMPGTLNMFTIKYAAYLDIGPNGAVLLNGFMFFYDWYDFDYHAGGRSEVGQYKTGFGRMIPGKKFLVTSEIVKISGVNNDPVTW